MHGPAVEMLAILGHDATTEPFDQIHIRDRGLHLRILNGYASRAPILVALECGRVLEYA